MRPSNLNESSLLGDPTPSWELIQKMVLEALSEQRTLSHTCLSRDVLGDQRPLLMLRHPPQAPPESGSLPTLPTLINLCCVPIVCNQLNIKTNNVNEWSCSFPCPFISHLTSPLVSRKSLVFPGFIIGSSETQLTECFVDYEAPLSILPPLILITILW